MSRLSGEFASLRSAIILLASLAVLSVAAVAQDDSQQYAWAANRPLDIQSGFAEAQRAFVEALEADPSLPFNPLSILVKYTDDATPEAKQLSMSTVGGTPILAWQYLPNTNLVRVQMEPTLAVDLLNSGVLPGIEYAELDGIVRIDNTPNDPQYNNLWGMNNTGQTVNGDPGVTGADINAPEAWDTFTGDPNFVIAVIDTGIDRNHPDLAANIWINPGEVPADGIDNDGNGFVDDVYGWDFYANDNNPMDENNHGTHCAGTIGGVGNNGIGVVGVNWRCKLAALRFLGPFGGSNSGAISAVNYCIGKGIKVSNNSWGGGGFSQTLLNAINSSANIGHVFVASAGNNANNNDVTPHYPSSYTSANLLAVAATDNNDNLWSSSNYGLTSVDVGAPGVNILSSIRGTGYSYFNGTSMATPHVAGLAALLYGRNPGWTHSQVKSQIMSTARPVTALSGRCVTGGVINAQAAVAGGGCTAPSITTQPGDQTGCSGDSVSFSVAASGSEPLGYQWRRGTTPLANGGNISGATTAMITINPVGTSDAATNYNCVVTNACGSATSDAATLTVIGPGPTCLTTDYVDRDHAGCEDGTAQYPFNTVDEGINQICTGGEVFITAGTYPEPLTINRAMALRATGGTVNIRP